MEDEAFWLAVGHLADCPHPSWQGVFIKVWASGCCTACASIYRPFSTCPDKSERNPKIAFSKREKMKTALFGLHYLPFIENVLEI